MDSLNRGINSIHQKVNLLTSYSSIYKNPAKIIEFPKNKDKLMIDSGAFDLLIKGKLEDYPFSPEEYANVIKNLEDKPDYVVSMDYICTQEENNNIELIQKTIKNAEILRREFERDGKICYIPVIQGYYPNEYLYCIKEMIKKKIIQSGDYISIGSLAARKKVKEAREIIKIVYDYLKKKNFSAKIHCFGLNLNVIKDVKTFNMVNSIDSLAWIFPYRFGRVKMFTRERMIEANSNGLLKEQEFYYLSLDATLKYIDFLNLRYNYHQRINSKSVRHLFKYKTEKEKFKIYKHLAQRLGMNENLLKKVNSLDILLDLITEQNKKFPRDLKLNISRIPAYTGEKFLLLEPKNSKIGKYEFLYLLISAIENAYKSNFNRSEHCRKEFIKILKNFRAQINTFELNIIEELLYYLKCGIEYDLLFKSEDFVILYSDFEAIINKIKNKIELKVYKIEKNYPKQQKDLKGDSIKEEFFLLIEDFDN